MMEKLRELEHRLVWLVAATVVYAIAARMVYSLVFLRRRMKPAEAEKGLSV